jgi:hypothetical protein
MLSKYEQVLTFVWLLYDFVCHVCITTYEHNADLNQRLTIAENLIKQF